MRDAGGKKAGESGRIAPHSIKFNPRQHFFYFAQTSGGEKLIGQRKGAETVDETFGITQGFLNLLRIGFLIGKGDEVNFIKQVLRIEIAAFDFAFLEVGQKGVVGKGEKPQGTIIAHIAKPHTSKTRFGLLEKVFRKSQQTVFEIISFHI